MFYERHYKIIGNRSYRSYPARYPGPGPTAHCHPHAGLDTALLAIGNELTNGFAKPIDVLSLQEQSSSATRTQNIFRPTQRHVRRGNLRLSHIGWHHGGGWPPGLIYNTSTVSLIGQTAFGTVNTPSTPGITIM